MVSVAPTPPQSPLYGRDAVLKGLKEAAASRRNAIEVSLDMGAEVTNVGVNSLKAGKLDIAGTAPDALGEFKGTGLAGIGYNIYRLFQRSAAVLFPKRNVAQPTAAPVKPANTQAAGTAGVPASTATAAPVSEAPMTGVPADKPPAAPATPGIDERL